MFTNYLLNRFAFNPAADVPQNNLYGNLLYRKQWVGLSDAPATAAAGVRNMGSIPLTTGAVISRQSWPFVVQLHQSETGVSPSIN